jgi:osmoprotectant transport system permease protein
MSAGVLPAKRAGAPLRIHDRVALVLLLPAFPALWFGTFLSVAPNRLADGRPLSLPALGPLQTALICAVLLGLLLAAFVRERAWRSRLLFICGAALLIAVPFIAGYAAGQHLDAQEPARRVSLGSGFWVLFAVGLLVAFQGLRDANLAARIALPLAVAIALIVLAAAGAFDALSLAREFRAERTTFATELVRHVALVASAILLAGICAVPLTLAAVYRKGARSGIFAVLNLLQTIPSIALFGLMIAPLSLIAAHIPFAKAIGIAGIGATPALIALVLYALLPLVRSADAGLRGVPADIRDAARAMGMTPRQIFWQVDLPLALPALVSGLRVATVQSIGLAVVAALIGAGGLGTFVFQGIGEYVLDLVLVGALPTILLAALVDASFQLVLANLRARP